MMRKLAVVLALAGALGSNFANALGLGELKLNSALNQKFDAEIKLLNVGDLSKNEILPNLANHEDFSRAGVERVFFLTSMKFDVRFRSDGSAYIKVTTDKIVREPFLNFLVELHWPSGRILREYTVLLDPPIFSETPAAGVSQAATQPPAAPREPEPKKKVEKSVSRPSYAGSTTTPRAQRSSAGEGGGSVRVKKNDTLWGIAKENRPGDQVTIRQTMLAIQRHNPHAFIRNNINLLKAGQLLKIPNVDQIRGLSASEVQEEIARQNDAWRNRRTIDATKDEELPSVEPEPQVEEEYVAQGQLKLVTDDAEEALEQPEELAASASGASLESEEAEAPAVAEGSVSALPEQQAGGDESGADSAGSVAAADVEDLQEQIESLKRLLSLKDQQLAMLQANSANQNAAGGETNNQQLAGAAVGMDQGAQQTAVAAEETAAAEAQPAKVDESKQDKGLVATLLDNPIYIGLTILVILVGLVVLGAISRRRNEEQEYPQDLQSAIASAQSDVELPEDLESELEADDTIEPEAQEPEQDLAAERKVAELRKLIEEADIYIAYGRYERALEMLQPAVNQNPSAWALRLKLVEIFIATGDEAGLSQQEADLQAIGNEEALAKLTELKALAQEDVAEIEETDGGSIDFDLDQDASVAEEETVADVDDEIEQFAGDPESESETDDSDQDIEFTLEDTEAAEQDDTAVMVEPEQEVSEELPAQDEDFLGDTDEAATKLELGRAYIDMADKEAAIDILNEVVEDGNAEQKEEAQRLLDSIAS